MKQGRGWQKNIVYDKRSAVENSFRAKGKAPQEHCEEIFCKSCKAKYFAFMAPGVGGRWEVA